MDFPHGLVNAVTDKARVAFNASQILGLKAHVPYPTSKPTSKAYLPLPPALTRTRRRAASAVDTRHH